MEVEYPKVRDLPDIEEKGDNKEARIKEMPSSGYPADHWRNGPDQCTGNDCKGSLSLERGVYEMIPEQGKNSQAKGKPVCPEEKDQRS